MTYVCGKTKGVSMTSITKDETGSETTIARSIVNDHKFSSSNANHICGSLARGKQNFYEIASIPVR